MPKINIYVIFKHFLLLLGLNFKQDAYICAKRELCN